LEGAPLRDPHHSASAEGLLGGGISLMPGEISLAHNGVLFLDEAPEFSPRVLQALREPLEQGRIQVARAGRSTWFPSRFLLALTANCCPCGQRGKERGVCFCSAQEVRRYWDRIGNALMDRIDLRVFVKPASTEAILHEKVPSLATVRAPIHRAGTLKRLRDYDGGNDGLTLPKADRTWLAERAALEDWSTRGLQSVLRVARTLADLDGTPEITPGHLNEAAALRTGSGREPWLE